MAGTSRRSSSSSESAARVHVPRAGATPTPMVNSLQRIVPLILLVLGLVRGELDPARGVCAWGGAVHGEEQCMDPGRFSDASVPVLFSFFAAAVNAQGG